MILKASGKEMLVNMGKQIRLARLRRGIQVDEIADKAGISRVTVWAVEKGMDSVAIGNYAAILSALEVSEDFNLIAREDAAGHEAMDARLLMNVRIAGKETKKPAGKRKNNEI